MEATIVTQFVDLKIPLEEILEATHNFAEKNIIGKGGFGNVYRGQLIRSGKSIKVAARRLGRNQWQGDVEFWTEISMLSSLAYLSSIVSLIGYCDEKGEKIIIYHYYKKGSLSTYISDPTTLDWSQRLNLSMGVANALEYIHDIYNCSYYVIHRNVNSYTIVLDDSNNPRLSGFEHSIKHSVDRKDQVFRCEAIGTQGYMDPAIEKGGGVTHKSDIYSFGVVLFEILSGRKANEDNKLLSPLAKFHYEKGTLHEIIHPDLWKQMSPQSFKCFAEAAYSCLQEDPTQRPDAAQLYYKFDQAYSLQQTTTTSDNVEKRKERYSREVDDLIASHSSCPQKVKNLDHWRIEIRDILLAVDCFQNESLRFDGHVNSLLKTDLECFNREYLLFVEGVNKDEPPKKYYTVMIKFINIEEYHQKNGEEYVPTELEVLSSCNHKNIESFLGFCEANGYIIIVSEFVSTDYLRFCLYDRILTWEKRLKICIEVARGLNYLHNEMEDEKMVIHCDINSKNIVLDKYSWSAKIVEFGHSVVLPQNLDENALHLNSINVTNLYMDPEYVETGKLKRESDVYSFGVVMFEILCGTTVDNLVKNEGCNDKDLAHLARRWFNEGIIKRKVTPVVKGENSQNRFLLNKGPNEDSLETFIKIMYQCVAQKQNERPTMKMVVKELEKALSFQENNKDTLRMSFQDIELATQNFSRANYIGGGGFGGVFKGEVSHGHTIIAKKLDKNQGQGERQFYNELQILHEYKHENVIAFVGYSNETDEKIIVYEYAPNGSLDKHLDDARLTWRNRLKICIDVASGLDFLHGGDGGGQQVVIHRDIKTANILLFDDWKAKLGDFGLSLISTINKDSNYVIDHACGTKGYVDPLYLKTGLLTIESDIYSFGVVLFEILCGRAIYSIPKHESRSLLSFVKHYFEERKQDDLVFKSIKEELVSKSLSAFLDIVYKCLDDDREKRPTSKEVLAQLKKALQFQEDDKM